MKIFSKEELGRDGLVQAAAPSGTASKLINGKTLHSLLRLPVSTSKFLPLRGEKLKDIQDTFNNVDIRFIDEKSMVGQKKFTMVSKRLQEACPNYKDKPFGNISVVLLADFNQRPPVCDSPLLYCLVLYWLFKANAVISSGYNLY